MTTQIQYYSPQNIWVKYKSGNGTYLNTDSVVTKTEEHPIDTEEDKENLFRTMYHRNNSLRYCNGSYWKFVDAKLEDEYRFVFMKRYNTIKNYYGNGVVD